ncbi:MAG: hypothetical protein MZW92_71310 [Comamonadaceae bacterium]|nr:hypothetical protein [Comamonadaceae bacterium]
MVRQVRQEEDREADFAQFVARALRPVVEIDGAVNYLNVIDGKSQNPDCSGSFSFSFTKEIGKVCEPSSLPYDPGVQSVEA